MKVLKTVLREAFSIELIPSDLVGTFGMKKKSAEKAGIDYRVRYLIPCGILLRRIWPIAVTTWPRFVRSLDGTLLMFRMFIESNCKACDKENFPELYRCLYNFVERWEFLLNWLDNSLFIVLDSEES